MPEVPQAEIGAVRNALATAGAQLTRLLRLGPDPGLPAIGAWSVGEAAAHAAASAGYFLKVARGDREPEGLDEVAANNALFLASDPERDPLTLAERHLAGEQALLAYVDGLGTDPMVEVFCGVVAPLSTLLAVELTEVLVHGDDIARAAGLPWVIEREHAAVAAGGLLPLLPHLVDRQAAAGRRLRVELRLRGGERAILEFDDGNLRVGGADGRSVDCRLSVDPAVFLLLTFGRTGPWRPMLKGKLAAWGRRPWLGALLPRLFERV